MTGMTAMRFAVGTIVILLTPFFAALVVAEEPWLNPRRGIEALDADFVLPPFPPVDASNDGRIDVWGREYRLGACGLLRQATILGKPFFEKPMDLELEIGGNKLSLSPRSQHLERRAKGRVEFLSSATSTDADVKVKTTVEYDGMVRVDLSIMPRGKIELTGLRYRVRYPECHARFLHYVGAKSTPESQNLPKNSYSRAVPEGQGLLWRAPFKTLVWLGDYEKGFLWFCGTEQHWSPQDRSKRPGAISLQRVGEEVVLEIAPVTAPYAIDGIATYTFGFFATPVRPLTKGWRGWTCNYRTLADAAEKAHPGLKVNLVYLSGMHAAPLYEVVKSPQEYRRQADAIHARGRTVLQYFDAATMALGRLKNPATTIPWTWQPPDLELDQSGASDRSEFAWKPPEFKYFNDWKTEPTYILGYNKEEGYRQYTAAIASSFADWFCYQVEQHAKMGCDGSIDIDEWYPVPDMNARHGMGYVDQAGVRRPEYDWWAKRDLMKRIAAIFLRERHRPPILIAHTASMLVIPCTSFCDGILTGENLNTGYFGREACFDEYFRSKAALQECLKRGGENWYYYAAPKDRWAVEASGKQFGFAVLAMANLTKSNGIAPEIGKSEKAARDMLAMAVLHDNLVWPIFMTPQPTLALWKIRQDFGLADDDVQFVPYWSEVPLASASTPEIHVSGYLKGNRCLLAVANLGLTAQVFTLKLGRGVPGKPSTLKNAETGEQLPVVNGGLRLSLPERNYMLLEGGDSQSEHGPRY